MSFPDAEGMAIAFLKTVTPVRVATKVPATRPTELVRVYRTGGVAANRVLEDAQITVDAWAGSSVRAFELASQCREAFLHRSSEMPLVRRVTETGGLNYVPDSATGDDRYRFTVTLRVRAAR